MSPPGAAITFRPLSDGDLPLLHAWLNNPDVARWYGLGIENVTNPTMEHVIENYGARIRGEQPTFCYIIEAGGRPVGHIQAYRIGDYPIYARAIEYDDDAWGIDLFIGEDDVRGGGFGTRALNRFVDTEIFARPGVEVAVIAPNPNNARAIRCYEKAGFTHVKTVFVEIEGEEEYVMARRKSGVDSGSRVGARQLIFRPGRVGLRRKQVAEKQFAAGEKVSCCLKCSDSSYAICLIPSASNK